MVVLISGATHTGKTLLARGLVERRGWPCLSVDLLKMGLIRSGNTALTPEDDGPLTDYLWPIVREMVKTAVENGQDLIVEGGYLPFRWREDFTPAYLAHIRDLWLIMSRAYILDHFDQIKAHAHAAERRGDDSWCTRERLLADNAHNLSQCRRWGCRYVLIDGAYQVDPSLLETT